MTHLVYSPIGLGLAALGRPGYINIGHGEDIGSDHSVSAMEARTHEVLDRAWQRGVRYFDAARSYGAAEAFLASWLRERDVAKNKVTVASKWGHTYSAGWQVEADAHEVKTHNLTTLRRQWDESRSTLGSYLRLYQIHSATLESGVLDDREVLAELALLKSDGLSIGLTLTGREQSKTLQRALEISVDGVQLFDAVQATWNLLERSAAGALFDAKKAGLTVIIKEALANGRLTPRNKAPKFGVKLKLLKQHAARLNTSVDGLAIAAALQRPWVDVVLCGAATPEQLDSNLSSLDVEWDNEAETGLQSLVEPSGEYWRIRSELPWG